MVCALLALPALPGNTQQHTGIPKGLAVTPILQRVVPLPPADVRRVTVPATVGSRISVHYESLMPGRPVHVEILQREEANHSGTAFRSVRLAPLAERGALEYLVPESGDYVVVIRQPAGSKQPIHVGIQVVLESPTARGRRSAVQTISTEGRIAVGVFAFGFLWTVLLVAGAPIIRAFRRRGKPPSQIWYG